MNKFLSLLLVLCLSISATAQNVGIGTSNPQASLDVQGTVRITDGTQGAGKILTSGANGQATWSPPPAPGFFSFSTPNTLLPNQFVGLANSGINFIEHNLVVPYDCELTSLTFTRRVYSPVSNLTATVYIRSNLYTSETASTLSVVMPNTIQTTVSTTGAVSVLRGNLISVRFSWTGNSMYEGITAAVTYK